ncbi:hypothetical protein [Rickettsia endosymbiont of Rhinocyllus conicus]|uniref:hypothetical protein n=1 Tax=Rickettsia endosymbiont of Rhinocyllus conicus TaxID=3066252 RepID=UPI00313303C5
MRSDQVKEGLVASVNPNDPYKGSKQLQIEHWCHLYGAPLLKTSFPDELDFIAQVINDDACWEKVDSLEQVKLNRNEVGRRLLAEKTPDGKENPFDNFQKYRVACWCCFEDDIRKLFDEAQSDRAWPASIESILDSTYSRAGGLVSFWSHFITGYTDKFKNKLKLAGDNLDMHGYECAMMGKHVQALEFFWNKLQPILSAEKKEELLINTAIYYELFSGRANVDMIDFCLHRLDVGKYPELLKRDIEKNGHHFIFTELVGDYYFDRAQKLFTYLKPEDLPNDQYSTLVSISLTEISSAPDSSFVKAGYDMLSVMWNMPGFEEHKQKFLHELSYSFVAAGSIVKLITADKYSEILSEIVGSLNLEQVQNLKKHQWIYDAFVKNNLFNSSLNIVNSEQQEAASLEGVGDVAVLGANSTSISTLLDEHGAGE